MSSMKTILHSSQIEDFIAKRSSLQSEEHWCYLPAIGQHNVCQIDRIELDPLEERCDQPHYYNSKVKGREFRVGDLVLRKVTPNIEVHGARVMGPTLERPYQIARVIRLRSYMLEYTNSEAIPRVWNAEEILLVG